MPHALIHKYLHIMSYALTISIQPHLKIHHKNNHCKTKTTQKHLELSIFPGHFGNNIALCHHIFACKMGLSKIYALL